MKNTHPSKPRSAARFHWIGTFSREERKIRLFKITWATDDVKKLVKEKVEEIRRLKGMLQPDVEYMTEARKQIEHAELAKRFTELTGGCWHEITTNFNPDEDGWMWSTCSCGDRWSDNSIAKKHRNKMYLHAADILNVMWERKDCYGFIENIVKAIKYKIPLNVLAYFINDYILNPTALLREAVEFLEQIKGEGK